MKMIERKTWEEFRSTGLFLFINHFLQIFGWSICLDFDDNGNIIDCFPARSKFRGFSEDVETKAFKNITNYMINNSESLLDDFDDVTE